MARVRQQSSDLAGIARHGRLRTRGAAGFVVRTAAAVAAVALIGAGSVTAIATWQVLQGARPSVSLAMPGTTSKKAPTLTAQSGEVNMLLVATDTRDGQGTGFDDEANQAASSGVGNNDTTILVHISQDHSNMAVVSFPRDLILPIPACTNDTGSVTPASPAAMLNTALSRGGEKHGLACVANTIGSLTGLQIGYAGMITFDGVVAMADAVGGVKVCLATPIKDNNVTPALDLAAGNRELSGAQAAAFLRSRHGVGDSSDLGRISNQQTFMSALARQTVSAGTLTNPAKVLRLANTAFKHMTLSDTLTDAPTLARLALAVNTVGLSNMVFVQYPVTDDPDDANRVIVADYPAGLLNTALQTNKPVVLAADSLGRSAVRDPSAPTPTAPTTTRSAAQPSAPAQPASTGTPAPAATSAAPLPASVSGQSADTVTCAAKS
ncbi:LCP family protein [Curtobacterium sp. MCLR17_031]|uniref:LCP family protein n=1 Tax=Curtobacterium sp. MCLR17_031 TaxID=2175622 RepID=UPI0015E89D75|nr:LCP family protein [Curtobacterium sp. MCLR17_031]WIE59573.1 LCP family protein [Curtobacterium sp. MCLR17_031]